jgi:ubiquitin-like protein ATG12
MVNIFKCGASSPICASVPAFLSHSLLSILRYNTQQAHSKQTKMSTDNEAIQTPSKIKVHFVSVGNAPILRKSKFLMSSSDEFRVATSFLRKLLKLDASTTSTNKTSMPPLFLYIHSFVPSPDQRMGDLMDCFGVRGELVVHYSLMEAWG